MKISVRQVEQFVVAGLRKRLQLDFNQLKMVREADLECCVYYHLRNFLRTDPTWKVFARKHSIQTGHYVDLLIFRGTMPRFAIELKWNAASMSLKDRRSLRRCVINLGVHKAYFITTHYSKISFDEIIKIGASEKHHIFELVISLPYIADKRAEWREKRRKYTKYLEPRKRRRDTHPLARPARQVARANHSG